MPLHARFHDAALVIAAALVPIPVAQVRFDSRDVRAVVAQRVLDFTGSPCHQGLVTFNVMVGMDLDLHDALFAYIGKQRACEKNIYLRYIN